MRFLKNFLRKLKLTLIFQGGYPRSGLHYNVFQFPWRSSLFIPVGHSQKRGEKTWVIQKRRNVEIIQKRFSSLFIPEGYSQKNAILQRGKKTRVIHKWGNEEIIQKQVSSLFIPEGYSKTIHFTVFNFFDFSFPLGLNLGKMTLFSYYFFSLPSYFNIPLHLNIT